MLAVPRGSEMILSAERSDDEMPVWELLPNARELQEEMTEAIQANAKTWY